MVRIAGAWRKPVVSAVVVPRRGARLHAFFLAATVPLFLGAALSDYAYTSTFEVQWSNFASWLLAGGLVFGGGAIVFALVGLAGLDQRRALRRVGFLLLLAMWGLGLIDAFVHARDAWATMPTGFLLSTVVVVLSVAATWVGFSEFGARPAP